MFALLQSLKNEKQLQFGKKKQSPDAIHVRALPGGEGETRTPAPVARPTPLAGAPRHQLEYFCKLTGFTCQDIYTFTFGACYTLP